MTMKLEPKKCIICGKEFVPNAPQQKVCEDRECHKQRRKIWDKRHKEKLAMEDKEIYGELGLNPKKKHKNTMKQLARMAKQANKQGLSYGYLVARGQL